MKSAVLGTLIVITACGPGSRDGNGNHPDANGNGGGDGQTSLPQSQVYAHSGTKLYQIDTTTLAPVEVGTMGGIGTQSMTDIAIDKTDHMLGITLDKLYSIDATTGAATLVASLSGASGFTSLSFVPMDLNNPSSDDILVSANDQGDVYSINPTSGAMTKIGSYGSVSAGKVISSGDLIGVRGFGIYATVDVGTTTNDYLARIDPTTWKATPIGSGTGFNNIFGLGFWGGTIYGFAATGTTTGKIITIDPTTGVGKEVLSGSIRWYGAGVATNAPIIL